MKTSGTYKPTTQAVVSDPGGGGGAVASLIASPEQILTIANNFGASNNTGLSPGQRTWGIDVSNWTLNGGAALPSTAHIMSMTITLRAQHAFEGGSTSHRFNMRFKNPNGTWSNNAGQDVAINSGWQNFNLINAADVDGLFTPSYVLGPTFVVEVWITGGSPDGLSPGVMQMDHVLVTFDYVDDYNTTEVLLPTTIDNARGGTEPLWNNPTFALVEDSSGAHQQLYQSTVNLTAFLCCLFPARPDLISLSYLKVTHRVRYQNVTNPGTHVNPTVRWTWTIADGWIATGGPVAIYTNFDQKSQTGTVKWPFGIDVWGVYANTMLFDEASMVWAGAALKAGKFTHSLVYTFPTTYSSQRLNFIVDVAKVEFRYMATLASSKRGLFFRMTP